MKVWSEGSTSVHILKELADKSIYKLKKPIPFMVERIPDGTVLAWIGAVRGFGYSEEEAIRSLQTNFIKHFANIEDEYNFFSQYIEW